VYDFDDALYADTGSGPLYRRLAPKAAKAEGVLQVVDRVVAGNDTLAEWASARHRDVVVIPSCVDPSAYRVKTDFAVAARPRLGWVGSWSTEPHLRRIAAPLLHLHERLGARLVLIGPRTGDLGELEAMVDRVPWSPAAQHEGVARFDVGLMPLPDDPYSRGKCGYKLLQYLAAGVPAVASPVGVNRQVLQRAGLPGATTDAEWLEAVTQLLEMAEADRRVLGERGRRVVQEHYSFDAWRERWRAAVLGT
jgi:glycosyltransferase involved in cell wall biosynthesis